MVGLRRRWRGTETVDIRGQHLAGRGRATDRHRASSDCGRGTSDRHVPLAPVADPADRCDFAHDEGATVDGAAISNREAVAPFPGLTPVILTVTDTADPRLVGVVSRHVEEHADLELGH